MDKLRKAKDFMITAPKIPSTLDPSPKSRLGHKHGLGQYSINSSVPTSSNLYIQRKSTCACGGGLPALFGGHSAKAEDRSTE
jgi:hypothetical protein